MQLKTVKPLKIEEQFLLNTWLWPTAVSKSDALSS